MWQCLNNVPRPLSHQHQKLQSSSHCFHCSTTCSPTHTLTHTRSPAHSFSRRLPPPLFLSIPSSTSSSSSSSLHLSTLPYLCHWKDPPPLLFPPASLSPIPFPFRFLSIFHLSLPPSCPLPALTTQPRLICDAACKALYAAICAPFTPPQPEVHRGENPKSIRMLYCQTCHPHPSFFKNSAAAQGLRKGLVFLSLQGSHCMKKRVDVNK